jgi:FAD/FMN-containing dehydrogenase
VGREFRDAIAPHTIGGVYTNFLAREESDRIPAAHASVNYARLRELKPEYDPENVFRANPNLVPA